MARYVNLYKERNVVVSKFYDTDDGDGILECEYAVVIETDDGTLVTYPVAFDKECLENFTADELIKDMDENDYRPIKKYDCPARECLIKGGITEWVRNQGCVDGSSLTEAICFVVLTLERNGMWKDEYAKCIDVVQLRRDFEE